MKLLPVGTLVTPSNTCTGCLAAHRSKVVRIAGYWLLGGGGLVTTNPDNAGVVPYPYALTVPDNPGDCAWCSREEFDIIHPAPEHG